MNTYITKRIRALPAPVKKRALPAPQKEISLDDDSSSELIEAVKRIYQFTKTGVQPAKKKVLEFLVVVKKLVIAAWNSKVAFIIKHFTLLEHLVIISGILSVSFFIVVQLFWNNWIKTDESFELAYRFAVLDFTAIITFCFLNIIRCWEPEVKNNAEDIGYDDSDDFDSQSAINEDPFLGL